MGEVAPETENRFDVVVRILSLQEGQTLRTQKEKLLSLLRRTSKKFDLPWMHAPTTFPKKFLEISKGARPRRSMSLWSRKLRSPTHALFSSPQLTRSLLGDVIGSSRSSLPSRKSSRLAAIETGTSRHCSSMVWRLRKLLNSSSWVCFLIAN